MEELRVSERRRKRNPPEVRKTGCKEMAGAGVRGSPGPQLR